MGWVCATSDLGMWSESRVGVCDVMDGGEHGGERARTRAAAQYRTAHSHPRTHTPSPNLIIS